MRQYRFTCPVDGMCQPGHGGCFSRLGGEPWGVLFAAEPLGSDTEGPGAEDRYSHSGVGSSSWQGPGSSRNACSQRGHPGPSGGREKEGTSDGKRGKQHRQRGKGWGHQPGEADRPEKRRCSMKSRWKGESVNRRS